MGPNYVLTASHVVNWSVPGGVNWVVEVHRAGPTVSAISAIRRVFAFTRVTGSIGWTEFDEVYAVRETENASATGLAGSARGVIRVDGMETLTGIIWAIQAASEVAIGRLGNETSG